MVFTDPDHTLPRVDMRAGVDINLQRGKATAASNQGEGFLTQLINTTLGSDPKERGMKMFVRGEKGGAENRVGTVSRGEEVQGRVGHPSHCRQFMIQAPADGVSSSSLAVPSYHPSKFPNPSARRFFCAGSLA